MNGKAYAPGRIVIALAMLLAAAGAGSAAEPAVVVVLRVQADPAMNAPQAGWDAAASIRIDEPVGEAARAPVRLTTDVSILRTEDALALRFVCTNPSAPNFETRERDRDAEAYDDESVEVFIDVRDGSDYYHLVVNASGSVYDGRKLNRSWNGDWTAAVRQSGHGWEATVRIPFQTLGGPPAPGTYWLLNICRNARGPDGQWERSAWIAPGYHRPLGLLCFGDVDARPLFRDLHRALANLQRFETVGAAGAGASISASVATLESRIDDPSRVAPERFAGLLAAADEVSRTIEPSVQQAVMRAILETPRP